MNALPSGELPLLLGGNLSEERFSPQTPFPKTFSLKISPDMANLHLQEPVVFRRHIRGNLFNLEVLGRGLEFCAHIEVSATFLRLLQQAKKKD